MKRSQIGPKTYEAALERAQIKRNQPQKPRKPLKRGKGLASKPKALKGKSRAKRPKKLTDGQLKRKVWREFSIYIRTREADSEGFALCFTCPKRFWWRDLQAGHFIRGRLNANLLDERGCHQQCHRCNIHFQGNVVIYYKMMLLRYGQGVIDELLAQNNQTHKWGANELQGLLDKYKALNAANALVQS